MPSLYVTQPGARLELERGRFLATLGDEIVLSAPAARVDRVIVVGGCQVTTPALAFMLDQGIDLLFIENSRWIPRSSGRGGRRMVWYDAHGCDNQAATPIVSSRGGTHRACSRRRGKTNAVHRGGSFL